MKDKQGNTLLDLVIGKEVPDRPGLRYVRKAGEDAIYVVDGQDRQALDEVRGLDRTQPAAIQQLRRQPLWIRDYAIKAIGGSLAIVQRGEMRSTTKTSASRSGSWSRTEVRARRTRARPAGDGRR